MRISRSSIRAGSTRSTSATNARSWTSTRSASQVAKREKRVSLSRRIRSRTDSRRTFSSAFAVSSLSFASGNAASIACGLSRSGGVGLFDRLECGPQVRTPGRVRGCIPEMFLAERSHAPVRLLEALVDCLPEERLDERGERQALHRQPVKGKPAREPHRARETLHARASQEPLLVRGVVRPFPNPFVRHDARDEVAGQHRSHPRRQDIEHAHFPSCAHLKERHARRGCPPVGRLDVDEEFGLLLVLADLGKERLGSAHHRDRNVVVLRSTHRCGCA